MLHIFKALTIAAVAIVLTAPVEAQIRSQSNFTFSPFNPCTGESINFACTQNSVFRVESDGNGGFHFVAATALRGTGLSTNGTTYTITRATHFIRQAPDTSNFALNLKVNFKIVGPGPSNDYTLMTTLRLVAVDNELKINVFDSKIVCQ